MRQYYYFVSSLPDLSFESERETEIDSFLSLARENLSAPDYLILTSCSISELPPETVNFTLLKRWWGWEKALRNELVKLRAQKLDMEAEPFLKDTPPLEDQVETAKTLFVKDSPLDAEMAMLKARWDFLEAQKFGHYFDLEVLAIYYLQLQIIERKRTFDPEVGADRFKYIYNQIFADENVTSGSGKDV